MKVLIHEWVTGGGLAGSALPASWAAEGRAMRRAIEADFRSLDGVEVITTLDDRFAADASSETHVLVGAGQEEPVLRRLIGGCDYTVMIAPETGGVLESRARLIEQVGGTSLGSTPSAVGLTTDKRLLAEHLLRRGVRTPRAEPFDPRSGLPRGSAYPVVVKPPDGAGALQTYYLEGPDDDCIGQDLPVDMIIQPYCPGRPLSATFLVGRTGAVRLVGVGWQRVEVRERRFHYHGGRMPAPAGFALGGPLAAVRAVEGLRGMVGVDFVRDDETGATTVIEINPRPTTSYVGLSRLLPAGSIARAWIGLVSGSETGDDLRGMIVPGTRPGVEFLADGTVSEWRGADHGGGG